MIRISRLAMFNSTTWNATDVSPPTMTSSQVN